MRTVSKLLVIITLTMTSCASNDDITPTTNTDEFFKYSIDGGPEIIFDQYATGNFFLTTTNAFEKFSFRAGAEDANGNDTVVDGEFTFQDFATFSNTSTFNWGVSDGTTANFYFSQILAGFVPSPNMVPSNLVVCTVTVHPANVGDYLEFTFSGDYLEATDTSIQRTLQGSGRIRRNADQ